MVKLVNDQSVEASITMTSFKRKANYYVVPTDEGFHYYPIKVDKASKDNANIFRLEKLPPILVDGYIIIDRSIYYVTHADILRGVVRKSRLVQQEELIRDSIASTSNDADSSNTDNNPQSGEATVERGKPVSGEYKRRSEAYVGLEIDKDADSAWAEQIDSLLHVLSSKEGEWEVADATQPGWTYESCTIPDTD